MPLKSAQCQARGQVEVSVKFYFCALGNISASPPHFTFSLFSFLFLVPPSQIHLEAKSLSWGQFRIAPVSLTCIHRPAISFPFPIGRDPLEAGTSSRSLLEAGWAEKDCLHTRCSGEQGKGREVRTAKGMKKDLGMGYGFSICWTVCWKSGHSGSCASVASAGVARASVAVATGHACREGFQLVSWP